MLSGNDFQPFLEKGENGIQAGVSMVEFFAPVDNIHGALLKLVNSAATSLVIAMFGFDDPALAEAVKLKIADPSVFVQISLDKSQAGGVHERQILEQEAYPNTVIVCGTSEKGSIMHMKTLIVDGYATVKGSTNWSTSAETKQDNEMTVILSYPIAAAARARCDTIHAEMLAKAGNGYGAVFKPADTADPPPRYFPPNPDSRG